MVTAEPSSRPIVLSDAQRLILESIVRQTHCPRVIGVRAQAVLAAANGKGPSEAAREAGCTRDIARIWRDRFGWAQQDWGEAADKWDQGVLTEKVLEALEDRERPGAPPKFTPEQLCQIMAVAIEKPEECGRPISHWSARELADEAKQRQIVPTISPRHVGRFLKKLTCDPTRCVTGLTAPTRK
jgi:putative transposase